VEVNSLATFAGAKSDDSPFALISGPPCSVIFLEMNRSCERLLPDDGGKEEWLPPKVNYPDEWLQYSFMWS
jgi:hypothetical protein